MNNIIGNYISNIRNDANLALVIEAESIEKLQMMALENGSEAWDVLNHLHDLVLIELGNRFIKEYRANKRID